MHVITYDNADELYDARRDVTMMFVELAEERGRFTDANVWVRFDPLRFIDATDDGRCNYGDVEIVRTGAAISVLCDFYDRWEEDQSLLDGHTARFTEAIQSGRFASFPEIASIIGEALIREKSGSLSPWFNQVTALIFERYVRPYFARLANADHWKTT